MKGPSERLKYDLHRVWECPVCKRREKTAGSVAFRHCSCQMKQLDGRAVVMKLVVDGVQRIAPPVVIRHEVEAATMATTHSSTEADPVASSESRAAEMGIVDQSDVPNE
jgi:hypothetical protein